MAIATTKVVFDGHTYQAGEEIPDMGSLVCVADNDNGKMRDYEGLSADVDKLPHYADLETGSSAFFYDTSDVYKYEKTSDTWYKL